MFDNLYDDVWGICRLLYFLNFKTDVVTGESIGDFSGKKGTSIAVYK